MKRRSSRSLWLWCGVFLASVEIVRRKELVRERGGRWDLAAFTWRKVAIYQLKNKKKNETQRKFQVLDLFLKTEKQI